ncbi:hypothetical protein BGZ50_001217 [Haplosporangium sp. Z 11]|nr:hypothetical protein BGZ50_001217 [Haplosporangium sp. Z 11]
MDRVNTASAAYPQVRLAPLPSKEGPYAPAAVDYDLHESDYATQQQHHQHPYTPPPQHQQPISSPTTASSTASNWTIAGNRNSAEIPLSPQSDNSNIKVQVPLDFDLGALSIDDHSDSGHNDVALPLRFAEGESKDPVERVGYVDDTRFSSESNRSALDLTQLPISSPTSFASGVALPSQESQTHTPQRTASVDSNHSAVRAYAAANPNPAATYANSPVMQAATSQSTYAAQQPYGYGAEYHHPPQPHQRPPPFRGPPQPYNQYPPHDPRHQQQQQQYPGTYGANGYPAGYDQYGQPYGPEYGQEYYPDPQQQHYYGGGYPGQTNGFRPQRPGYGPPHPQQQFHGRPVGANLHPSPSMRGPPPGRGGPRPMMMGPGGPPGGPYGIRPPHRGDPNCSAGPSRVGSVSSATTTGSAGNGAPRKRILTIEALDEMRQRARNSNDPAAQLEYAKALIEAAVTFGNDDPDPKRQKKNKEALFLEGLKIIKRLATTGMGIGKPAYPDAQFFLANCYGNGSLGLQIDHDKAFNLYIQASKQNHPAATYRTAVCYELGAGTKRDHSRAVQFYRKAASLGDTAGMYKLGMVILKGLLGQQSNPREAITWLKRAAANADEDNPHALHELGLCFEKAGIPTVIPDEAYARELFTQAAGYGYAPSQFKLGHCYEYGSLTCPVDPRRSIAWYTRAAEQGDAESELGLSGWYLTGAEGVLKQSDTEAYLWARKAADKGLARAEYAVGYYSEVIDGL